MEQEVHESRNIVEKAVAIALPTVAIAMTVYQLTYTQYLIQGPTGHLITHLAFAFVVVLLNLILQSRKGWLLKWILLVASLAFSGYLMFYLKEIMTFRQTIPLPSDLIIGLMVIVVTFIVSYMSFGKTFSIVTALFLFYLVLGRYLPPPFTVAPVSFSRLIMWLSAGVGLDQGVYGRLLALSANYLFLLILFGSMLYAFGGVKFILGLGRWLGSKVRSGPAAVAVIGSSLLGTMTGSTVANITITGAYTIPLMKRVGYKPKQAAAIEAASSNGGQIMPPIMGATALIMAGFTGIPYVKICLAALVPAILYYMGLIFYVQLNAYKQDIVTRKEEVNVKELLLDAPLFAVPLFVLVFLLVKGYSLPFIAFWSMMSLVALSLINSIRKEARLNIKEVVDAITKGVKTACEIAVLSGMIGIVATSIETSGLGIKLPLLIEELSHGYLIIALLITMISSILVGMGVPTPAAYLLVAIGAAPSLVKMGVPLLQAHFFPMFFAVFSHLTPPIAVGALVASQISGSKYWPTSFESLGAASTAFLLPFFIIYAPVIILRPDAGLIVSITQIAAIPLSILSLQISITNYCFTKLGVGERVAFGITSILFMTAVFSRSYPFLLAGLILLIMNITRQNVFRRQAKAALKLAPDTAQAPGAERIL